MIIKELGREEFKQEFDFGIHSSYNNQFSDEGLNALYDYIEEIYSEENPFEMDAVGLIVQFTEYESLEECLQEVGNEEINSLDALEYHTIVIEVENSERIIISEF
jgi:uncharacterized protein YggL (DUF469 family)